jgi:hypothetical protein
MSGFASRTDVGPGLDLELDPPVPLTEVTTDLLDELLGRRGDPHRNTADHPIALTPEERCERTRLGPQLRVEQRVHERRLRHRVPSHEREPLLERLVRHVLA